MHDRSLDRRTLISTVGAGIGAATIGVGAVTARRDTGFPPEKHTTWGESGSLGDGTCRSFVTTNPGGKPVFVGAHFTAAELDGLPGGTDHHHVNLSLPDANSSDNPTHFRYLEYDWNPGGHPPPGVYTVPHFDWHFYTMDHDDVAEIPLGIAAYDIPDDQHPDDYVFGDPRVIEPAMGEHLLDSTSPEVANRDQEQFTHTYIYGVYDPAIDPANPADTVDTPHGELPVYEGDGAGEIHFVEPMVTKAFLKAQHEEVRTVVATPDAFPEAGWYPTEYVVRYLGNQDAYTVTLESFERFPAADDTEQ